LHYSRDYPHALPRAFDTVVTAKYLKELGHL
jgi:L-aspartate oxidase